MKGILISIILPVYNVRPYILDCLESLLNQGLELGDYEIICVNDGSTDGTEVVLNEYVCKYKNINLINQKNQGVSCARNAGFDIARGDYIWFIDPDDYISANALPYILNIFKETNCKLIKIEKDIVAEQDHFHGEICCPYIGSDTSQTATVWQYIVERKALLESKIRFNEQLAYGEDYLWECLLRYYITDIVSIATPIYHYRMRDGSAMVSAGSNKKVIKHKADMIKLAVEYKKLSIQFLEIDCNFSDHLLDRSALATQAAVIDIINSTENKLEFDEEINAIKRQEIYPYKYMKKKLFPHKTIKDTVRHYLEYPLPNQGYVKFCWRLAVIRRKLERR